MAVKRQKSQEIEWRGFASCELNVQLEEQLEKWDFQEDEMWRAMVDLMDNGYKISFSKNRTNDSYVASITCNDPGNKDAGMTLTAFSDGWYDALRTALFKHLVVLHDGWGTVRTDTMKRRG